MQPLLYDTKEGDDKLKPGKDVTMQAQTRLLLALVGATSCDN